jgi:hypothetical protein
VTKRRADFPLAVACKIDRVAGSRAVEQLRLVLAKVRIATVRNQVFPANTRFSFFFR